MAGCRESLKGLRTAIAAGLIASGILAVAARAETEAEIEALGARVEELYDAGKYGEATPLAERYAKRAKIKFGGNDPEYATAIAWLALLLKATNRLKEAEPLIRRALEIDEKSLGPDHPNVAVRINNLAAFLYAANRLAEAEPLMRRVVAIFEKSSGPGHPNVAAALNNLASLLQAAKRFAEAETSLRRALAIREKSFGPDHPDVAQRLNNLAASLHATNRFAEAETLLRRARAIDEKSLGPEHPNVARDLNNLATLLQATNRLAEAEPLYRRALAIDEKSFGPDHPDMARDLNNLAALRAALGDWAEAARLHRRAKPIMTASGLAASQGRANFGKAVLASSAGALRAAARAVYRASPIDPAALAEGFELAQWATQSAAAEALAQMSARFAKGAGALAALVRERQDLEALRKGEDKRLLAAIGAGNAELTAQLRASLAALDGDLAALDARLAREFPEYAALSAPKPLSLAETQALLAPDEALVVFLDLRQFGRLPEETLAWAVTRTEARWTSVSLGAAALRERVERLRCGLDASAWADPSGWADTSEAQKVQKAAQQARREGCKSLLGLETTDDEPPPFDLSAAHALYTALLGPVADLIEGKRLLVAASGPLARLPLGVLVREPPKVSIARKAEDFQGAAWLVKSHALTALPSVASLHALRARAKASPPAPEPFLGVGNPLLDGDIRNPAHVKRAREAREKQHCPKTAAERLTAFFAQAPLVGGLFRDGLANVTEIRGLTPLPETADELCAIARTLGAPGGAVKLGAEATETKLKAASESGALARARVAHFATHGLLSGESEAYLKAGAEPGLILTPPATATEADDGLLAASEVAQLKLNAEWVVLSACNTAGGEKSDTEALSGLARAFFYAGAKALLVSHWAVDSDAAVKLTTRAFAELRQNPAAGRAEAFRRSLIAMMEDTSRPAYWTPAAHPAVWAPFALVGEGGPDGRASGGQTDFRKQPMAP